MRYLEIEKKGLYVCFLLEKGKEAKLLKLSSKKGNFGREDMSNTETCRIVEIQRTGEKNYSFRGTKNFYDTPQVKLQYDRHVWRKKEKGRVLSIYQKGEGIEVETEFYFYDNIAAFSCQSKVRNTGEEKLWLESITSFSYGNLDTYKKGQKEPGKELEIYYAHNTWSAECRWVKKSLSEAGIEAYGNLCYDRFRLANHTGFSSGEYLPMGAVYNKREKETFVWQIEHNGAWSWELGCVIADYRASFLEKEYDQKVYLQLYGPQMEGAFWKKCLLPKECFRTVPVAVAVCEGNFERGIAILNSYRRMKKKITELPVIFNDYMNSLMGNSTTELLRPYIRKAAEAGCEIFVVDCGWYDIGDWQYTFGAYEECKERYPKGLNEVMDAIRNAGMKPGLWLELESFGIDQKKAELLPADWLLSRNGKPIIDSGRYCLDFRNPDVRKWASKIVERMVCTYGLSYLKIDYNFCISWGTDWKSDSLGDGLLTHNRAYLQWLETEMKKYPSVIWENCGSGGLRMDYAMLSRMDIQSVSDQEDYRKMAVIASNCGTAVLPEQAGIWAYPRREGDRDETVINMVSALLFRIHLGGHLPELSEERFELVKEAVTYYKKIRKDIPEASPFWPLGFHDFDAEWLCFGLHGMEKDYLAVIRRQAEESELYIPLGKEVKEIRISYPQTNDAKVWRKVGRQGICVCLPRAFSACLLEIF